MSESGLLVPQAKFGEGRDGRLFYFPLRGAGGGAGDSVFSVRSCWGAPEYY